MMITTKIACCAAVLLTLASCWASGLSEDSEGTPSISGNDYSSITIRCAPSTEALVIDPEGRRTGVDVSTGKSYQEIPNASYWPRNSYMSPHHEGPTGIPGLDIMYLSIPTPANGDYRLTFTALRDTIGHPQSLRSADITCYCPENPKDFWDISFFGVHMVPGDVHNFVIHFNKTPSGKCFVTGGLVGGGESAEIDQLLSYVNITKAKTKLPPGSDSTDLFIIYSEAILPESFKAVLNEQDISNLFTPVAGGHEIARLPVEAGKNVLTLSVRSNVTEEDIADTDILEFRVE